MSMVLCILVDFNITDKWVWLHICGCRQSSDKWAWLMKEAGLHQDLTMMHLYATILSNLLICFASDPIQTWIIVKVGQTLMTQTKCDPFDLDDLDDPTQFQC